MLVYQTGHRMKAPVCAPTGDPVIKLQKLFFVLQSNVLTTVVLPTLFGWLKVKNSPLICWSVMCPSPKAVGTGVGCSFGKSVP